VNLIWEGDDTNDNGSCLLDFALTHNVVIGGTFVCT
jgi:hypothetical protein